MTGEWPASMTRISGHVCGYPRRVPDPEWFNDVHVGSVLREGLNGVFRVVREVTRRADGTLWGVAVTIRRQSWTGRAYTILTYNDLKCRRFSLIPNVRVKPKTMMDVRIAQAIQQPCNEPYIITASEVVGTP